MTRARKNRIVVSSALIGGVLLDIANRNNGSAIVFDQQADKYIHIDLEALYAAVNHDHEIGDMTLIFENALI